MLLWVEIIDTRTSHIFNAMARDGYMHSNYFIRPPKQWNTFYGCIVTVYCSYLWNRSNPPNFIFDSLASFVFLQVSSFAFTLRSTRAAEHIGIWQCGATFVHSAFCHTTINITTDDMLAVVCVLLFLLCILAHIYTWCVRVCVWTRFDVVNLMQNGKTRTLNWRWCWAR